MMNLTPRQAHDSDDSILIYGTREGTRQSNEVSPVMMVFRQCLPVQALPYAFAFLWREQRLRWPLRKIHLEDWEVYRNSFISIQ